MTTQITFEELIETCQNLEVSTWAASKETKSRKPKKGSYAWRKIFVGKLCKIYSAGTNKKLTAYYCDIDDCYKGEFFDFCHDCLLILKEKMENFCSPSPNGEEKYLYKNLIPKGMRWTNAAIGKIVETEKKALNAGLKRKPT